MKRFLITCLIAASTIAHAADTYVAKPDDFDPPNPTQSQIVTWKPNSPDSVTGLIFGSDAFTSITDASSLASAGDTVFIASGVYAEGNEIFVQEAVNFVGDGAGETILDGGSSHPVITLNGSSNISGLTIQNGFGNFAAGGMLSFGAEVTISNVHFLNNSSESGLGALFIVNPNDPLGLPTPHVVRIEGCLFSNNVGLGNSPSCIYHEGDVINPAISEVFITNTTFSSNDGPAIRSLSGTLSLIQTTFYDNSVAFDASTDPQSPPGSSVIINNSLVLDSFNAPTISSNGTNFLATDSIGVGDLSYSNTTASVPADLIDIVLSDNGGATASHALAAGSAAIDAGTNADAVDALGIPLEFDQRGLGFPRIVGGMVDIGAFENSAPPLAPALTISLIPANISENGGTTTITVTRNTDTATSLEVALSSDNPSGATLQGILTIPAGQTSAQATLTAIDNTFVDGDRSLTVTAAAVGFADVSEQIQITDDDTPTLTLTVADASISENGGASLATITRNSDTESFLTVILLNDDTSEATIPSFFNFLEGQTSTSVAVTAVDDDIIDGDQTVTFTATATGFTAGSDQLDVTDDDAPTLTLTITDPSISENGGTTTVTVTRNTETDGELEVALVNGNPSEANLQATLSIPAGQNSAQATLTALDNSFVDGDRTIDITATADGFTDGDGQVEITDDDVPTLTLAIADTSISEGGGNTTITVTRNTETDGALEVTLVNGNSSEANLQATLSIPAGQDSAQATLTALDNSFVDGDRTLDITATADGFTAGNGQVQITDDDVPTLTINIDPTSISEGGTTTVTLTRNTDPSFAESVDISSDDQSKVSLPEIAEFASGEIETIVTLTAIDNSIADGDRTVTITAAGEIFPQVSDTVDVIDDEVPTLTLTLDPLTIPENGGASSVIITRNTDQLGDLTINLSSNDETEVTIPATAIFGEGEDSITIPVTAVDDSFADGPQTVIITAVATGFPDATATLEVLDDEIATLTVSISPATISENGGTSTATITRNTEQLGELTVNLSSNDETEVTVPATAIFGEGEDSITIPVTAVDDSFADGSQTVIITTGAIGFPDATGTLEVLDDEIAALTISISPATISENGGISTATLTRNTDPDFELTINLSSDDETEATVPPTAIFGEGESSTTFPITAVNDLVTDGTKTVTITASGDGFPAAVATLDVTDDEVPTLTLAVAPASISENGGTTIVTVTRNTETEAGLEVTLVNGNESDATLQATITIPAGQGSAQATLTAIDNAFVDGNRILAITATADGFTDGNGQVEITDDDASTLTLAIANASIAENGGTTTVNVTRNTETDGALTVTLSSSNESAAIIQTTLTIPAGQLSASATLDAVNNEFADGTRVVTITAAALGFTSGTGSVDVTDDDPVRITLEGGGNLIEPNSFSRNPLSPSETNLILRRNGTLGDVIVSIGVAGGSQAEIGNDFFINGAATPNLSLTIPDGDSELVIPIQAINDTAAEIDETFAVLLLPGSYVSENSSVSISIAQNDYGVTSLEDFNSSFNPNVVEGTLRQAIINAKAGLTIADAPPSVPVIVFLPDLTGELSLVAGAFQLNLLSFSIIGPGSDQVSINGGNASRIFFASDTSQDLTYSISGLTMTAGFSESNGGAIFSDESLLLTDCVLSENAANIGGAIANEGILAARSTAPYPTIPPSPTAEQLTTSPAPCHCATAPSWTTGRSSAVESRTGKVANSGWIPPHFPKTAPQPAVAQSTPLARSTNISNTTISGNQAGFGAGISNERSTLSIWQSTIVLNAASNSVGGILTSRAAPVSTTLHNTIVAGNTQAGRPSDLSTNNPSFVNVNRISSSNLIGHASTAGGLSNGLNGNVVGVGATNLFRPLADNGGPTETHALLTGSPAINAGNPAFALDSEGIRLATDQRGFPRFAFGTNDIGAFEASENPIAIVSVKVIPDASATIRWTSEAGVKYDVLRSTDLETFQTIESQVTAVGGLTSYTDSNPPLDRAFYVIRSSTAK